MVVLISQFARLLALTYIRRRRHRKSVQKYSRVMIFKIQKSRTTAFLPSIKRVSGARRKRATFLY